MFVERFLRFLIASALIFLFDVSYANNTCLYDDFDSDPPREIFYSNNCDRHASVQGGNFGKIGGSYLDSSLSHKYLFLKVNEERDTKEYYFIFLGHDTLQQKMFCYNANLKMDGAVNIVVGGVTALPELLSEDRHELFLSPRQAYPILESGQGKALFIGDVKPHRYSYAFQEGIAREDVIELATEIQAQYKTAAEWRPLLLVGSRQDYYDYLNRVKTPLVGVYFLDGGIEAHKKYLAERKAMLYAKEERKKPTCPMQP